MLNKRCSIFISILLAVVLITASATAQTPAYQNFPAPSGFATNAGEPSIGVDWNTGKVMYQAVLETDRVTFSNTSPATAKTAVAGDHGASWAAIRLRRCSAPFFHRGPNDASRS